MYFYRFAYSASFIKDDAKKKTMSMVTKNIYLTYMLGKYLI